MNPQREPQRVLNIIASLEAGGIQSLVMNIYRHIDRNKIQFDFAVRESHREFYDDEICELGGRIFRLPWHSSNPFAVWPYKKGLRSILDKNGPYIAIHSHANFFNGLVMSIAKKKNIPLRISHSHSASEWDNSIIRRKIWMPIMRKQILVNATHLFACSNLAAKWLYGENILLDSRFDLINNGIYLDDFIHCSSHDKRLHKELSIPDDAILVGHVGRFDHVKNHEFLINLFNAYIKIEPSAHLILVGDGHLRPQIEANVIDKDLASHVHFLGARSDIPAILKLLDVFILPSFSEGLSMVLIESQISGTPCVVSDVVPKEVDLGLGTVKFVNLQAGFRSWIELIQEFLHASIPPLLEREAALKNAGYDIEETIEQLEKLYLSPTHGQN